MVALRASISNSVNPSVFEYHEKRMTGLIPQNEEAKWGYEDPRQREVTRVRHINTHVAQHFFEVDWNQGFTGRGMDPRSRDYHPAGPMNETLANLVGAERLTPPEERRLWQAVDRGDDDGVGPSYRDLPNHKNQNTSSNDDEDVGPFGESSVDDERGPPRKIQQHASLEASSQLQDNLRDIAAQALQGIGDDDVDSLKGTRQEAELDPTGEMRNILIQIGDGGSQTSDEQPLVEPSKASRDSTQHFAKKRDWASVEGIRDDDSLGASGDEGCEVSRGPKRARTSHFEETNSWSAVKDLVGDVLDEDSEAEPSPSRLKSSRILQAIKKRTSGLVKNFQQGVGSSRSAGLSRLSTSSVAAKIGCSNSTESEGSPVPSVMLKREGNKMHNDLVDAIISVREQWMNIAKRKGQGAQNTNVPRGARNQHEEYHHAGEPKENNVRNSRARKASGRTADQNSPTAKAQSNKTGEKPVSSPSKRAKRWRGISLDDLDEDSPHDTDWQPQPKRKRVRLEQHQEAQGETSQNPPTSDDSKLDSSYSDLGSSETDISSVDTGTIKAPSNEDIRPIITKARPTFDYISTQWNDATKTMEWMPDKNEADEIVVTCVRRLESRDCEYPPGLPPRIEPSPRPWSEEEQEELRYWVQDHGVQNKWREIAWCLHRSEKECHMRYRETVMARNKKAGRDLEAGLPGWVDHELELTPAEIARLVAEDIVKRDKERKKKADKHAEAARGTELAREAAKAVAENEVEEEQGLNAEEEPAAAGMSEVIPEARRAEGPDDDEKEPEVRCERRAGVKIEPEVEGLRHTEAATHQVPFPPISPNPAALNPSSTRKRARGPELEGDTLLANQPATKRRAATLKIALKVPAHEETASASTSRLRPRKAKIDVVIGDGGLVHYNPNAKSFPRRTEMGTLVDARGRLLKWNEQKPRLTQDRSVKKDVEKKRQESEAPGHEGEEQSRHEEDKAPHAEEALQEDLWSDEQEAIIRGKERAERDHLTVGDGKDNDRGEYTGERVGRYRYRLGSPSDDGSLGGFMIQGPVVEQFSKGARRFGVDRNAGRTTS